MMKATPFEDLLDLRGSARENAADEAVVEYTRGDSWMGPLRLANVPWGAPMIERDVVCMQCAYQWRARFPGEPTDTRPRVRGLACPRCLILCGTTLDEHQEHLKWLDEQGLEFHPAHTPEGALDCGDSCLGDYHDED